MRFDLPRTGFWPDDSMRLIRAIHGN